MTYPLRDFQNAFVRALDVDAAGDADPTLAMLVAQPGFAVYRNTVLKGCIDALAANYPAVVRLVGDAWFRAAAAVFVRTHPPRRPMLVDYGEGFAGFLAAFEPAAELHYLADVARLDRFWIEAHVATDQTPLPATALTELAAHRVARAVLRLHPSARWAWFAEQPIYSLWQYNRDSADTDALRTLAWRGQGALLVRPHATVHAIELTAGGCAFVDACADALPLADAGIAALAVEHAIDLSALLAELLDKGAFAAISIIADAKEPNL